VLSFVRASTFYWCFIGVDRKWTPWSMVRRGGFWISVPFYFHNRDSIRTGSHNNLNFNVSLVLLSC
jgi:hypothetical protein